MSTNDRRTGMPVRRWRRLFSKRLLLAWGSVLAAALLVTSGLTMAAFTDAEYARLGDVTTGQFNLQIRHGGGGYGDYKTLEGALLVPLAGGANLIPGADPVTTTIDVKNAGDYTSTINLEVTASGSDALINELNLTVKVNSGATQSLVRGTPKSLPDLAKDGNMLITVGVQLDQTAGNGLLGQQATLTAKIIGESKVPGA